MSRHSLISLMTIRARRRQATRALPRGRPLLKDWPLNLVKVIGAGASVTRSGSGGIRATPC